MRLRDFMSCPLHTCSPLATMAQAARAMEEHDVGCLVVVDHEPQVVGIVTDRDLARALAHGHDGGTMVGEVMSRQVRTIRDVASFEEAAGVMDATGVRRLPVVDSHGRPVGMICFDDLYNYLTQETLTLSGAIRGRSLPRG